MTSASDPQVLVAADRPALAAAIGADLIDAVAEAIEARGSADVCLTGGSLGSELITALVADPRHTLVDWSAVQVWWGDERYLPGGDADRNDTQNDHAGLSRLGLDPAQVHRVRGPDETTSAEESAQRYAAEVRAAGRGAFDVVLLGVGPDGHCASLFPHHPAQRVTDAIAVAVHDSPKPPPVRVSLTYEALSRSREVWFVVAGADKAAAVAAALAPGADRWDVPASGPRGENATRWLLDPDAADQLPQERITGHL
jgi:6-phosphogluconolactonase